MSVIREVLSVNLKIKILLLHIPVSRVHGNITFYYVHGTLYISVIRESDISTTILGKFYAPENMKLVSELIV